MSESKAVPLRRISQASALSIAMRVLGVATLACTVFLLSVRPIYAAFAAAGLLIAVTIRYVVKLFLPLPSFWQLVSELLSAVVLGWMAVYGVIGSVLPNELPVRLVSGAVLIAIAVLLYRFRKSRRLQRVVFEAAIFTIFPILSYLALREPGAPHAEPGVYSGKVTATSGQWSVTHSVVLALNGGDSDLRGDNLQEYREVRNILQQCGWHEDAQLYFSQTQQQNVDARWFPFTTVNPIQFPPMNCEGRVFLSAIGDSSLTFHVPSHFVRRVNPRPQTRSEELFGDMETITIPVKFNWQEAPSVQVEVVAPFLQNSIGVWLVTGAAWEPLKWVLLAICGIFSEQIKKSVLIPNTQVI